MDARFLPLFVVVPMAAAFLIPLFAKVWQRFAKLGLMPESVGPGLFTVNVWSPELPPPGPEFATCTLRGPVAAPASIVTFAVNCVELFTVFELMVMPGPNWAVLTPWM